MATPCCPAPVSRDDSLLAHAERQQGLADGVVDFVSAGVVEVFAFEVDLRAAAVLCETLRVVEGIRPADEGVEEVLEAGCELRVAPGAIVFLGQFLEGPHERFGDEPAAEFAETALGVGDVFRRNYCIHGKMAFVAAYSRRIDGERSVLVIMRAAARAGQPARVP